MSDTLHNQTNVTPDDGANQFNDTAERVQLAISAGGVVLGLGEIAVSPDMPVLGKVVWGVVAMACGGRGWILMNRRSARAAAASNGSNSGNMLNNPSLDE